MRTDATSDDGILWSRLLAPVLHPQVLEALSFSPCVLKNGDLYRIWYAALHESPGGGVHRGHRPCSVFRRLRVDGEPHDPRPGPPGSWDEHAVQAPCVVDEGTSLRMWYEGEKLATGDSTRSVSAIGLAALD